MKKFYILFVFVIALSACNGQMNFKLGGGNSSDPGLAHENRFDNNPNTKTDIEMYNEQEDNKKIPDCYTMCNEIILDTCMDEIVELEADDIWYEDSILNSDHCESICPSIPDSAKECIAKVKKCESIRSFPPYCIEEESEDIYEEPAEKEVLSDCDTACTKYKACAMFSAEVGEIEGDEAYRSCLEVCQTWDNDTVTCMNNTNTGTSVGCMKLSQCGLAEYQSLLNN
ncbi:hypothetical protein C0583_00580 [Candidatus Parcubacteria bacterium]|nr:MAG: hypothetical protein C0583_00580 [Candidatus Parcubacteria bacterium]